MKILYAVQGTGNGHITRAAEIIPALERRGMVDVLVSGSQSDILLPKYPKYSYRGISFVFGKNGGIDLWNTLKINRKLHFLKEIKALPVKEYDLIINDFEPISAWAARLKGVPIISLSHQSALMQSGVPRPNHKDWLGSLLLRFYAPVREKVSFHFKSYGERMFTPIIRSKVRNAQAYKDKHITVYLPAYSDKKILKVLKHFPLHEWHLFSKHADRDYKYKKHVKVFTLDDDRFVESMAKSKSVLCGAGFETPAEALYLRKKLLVVPMKNQYEQHFNAAALMEMGVPVLPAFKKKHVYEIWKWLKSDERVRVAYEDVTQKAIDELILIYIEKFVPKASEELEIAFGSNTPAIS
ncbi:MAG: glycosyl transferase [Cyclobacteriaceae bacterium]|nr:glycosyl transferase [Cyclobacteriaceae bacterium]